MHLDFTTKFDLHPPYLFFNTVNPSAPFTTPHTEVCVPIRLRMMLKGANWRAQFLPKPCRMFLDMQACHFARLLLFGIMKTGTHPNHLTSIQKASVTVALMLSPVGLPPLAAQSRFFAQSALKFGNRSLPNIQL